MTLEKLEEIREKIAALHNDPHNGDFCWRLAIEYSLEILDAAIAEERADTPKPNRDIAGEVWDLLVPHLNPLPKGRSVTNIYDEVRERFPAPSTSTERAKPEPGDWPALRSAVLSEVHAERERQDAKWGIQNHEPPAWIVILGEEFGEVCTAACDRLYAVGPNPEYREELVQVAAVSVAMIECYDRNAVDVRRKIEEAGK